MAHLPVSGPSRVTTLGSLGRTAAILLTGAALMATVGACSRPLETRGNLPTKTQMADIRPGESTKAQVAERLGSPSSIAPFDDNIWFYISKREDRYAILQRKTRDQSVLEMRFDSAGVLREIKQYGMENANNVKYVARTTPTHGSEPGVLESLYDTLLRGPINRDRVRAMNRLER